MVSEKEPEIAVKERAAFKQKVAYLFREWCTVCSPQAQPPARADEQFVFLHVKINIFLFYLYVLLCGVCVCARVCVGILTHIVRMFHERFNWVSPLICSVNSFTRCSSLLCNII